MYIKDFRKALDSRAEFVQRNITRAEKMLADSPDGRLRIKKRGKSVSYYYVLSQDDKNGCVIDKSDKTLVKDLAQKAYMTAVLSTSKEEYKHLHTMIKRYPQTAIEELYYQMSDDRKSLVRPIALNDEDYAKRWLAQTYNRKGFGEGDPNFVTLKGERVRSKSEQIIADRLTYHNIPYKYECPIRLDIGVFHPDFTVLRLRDRKEIYWEHCGAMDKQSYADYAVNRFNVYARNNIILGKDLVATFETGMFPLDTEILDKFIFAHFK